RSSTGMSSTAFTSRRRRNAAASARRSSGKCRSCDRSGSGSGSSGTTPARGASTRPTARTLSTRRTPTTTRSGRPTRATSGALLPAERQREARRAALALAQLLRAVDEHLDAGGLEPPPRLAVVLGDEHDAWRQRERVAPERLELVG